MSGSATAAAPAGHIVTSAASTSMPPRKPIAAANTIHDDAGLEVFGRVSVICAFCGSRRELHLRALADQRRQLQGVPVRQAHAAVRRRVADGAGFGRAMDAVMRFAD